MINFKKKRERDDSLRFRAKGDKGGLYTMIKQRKQEKQEAEKRKQKKQEAERPSFVFLVAVNIKTPLCLRLLYRKRLFCSIVVKKKGLELVSVVGCCLCGSE